MTRVSGEEEQAWPNADEGEILVSQGRMQTRDPAEILTPHPGKEETPNIRNVSTGRGRRSGQDLWGRNEGHASVGAARGWTPALEGRAATSGGFCEARTLERRGREGQAAIGTEFRGGGRRAARGSEEAGNPQTRPVELANSHALPLRTCRNWKLKADPEASARPGAL